MPASIPLQATAIGWLLVSLGHTVSGQGWQSDTQFRQIPTTPYTCARAGWYQGSVFFIITALINYNWSKDPELLQEPVNKAIAALATALIWASSAWYFKKGVKTEGAVTGLIGALQVWAAFY